MKSNHKVMWSLLIVSLAVLLSGPGGATSNSGSQNDPRVKVDGETWEGEWFEDKGGYAVFRGIPYAAPPTGGRRWQPPSRRTPEPGLHMAKANGPACIQTQRLVTWDRNILKAFGLDQSVVPDLMNISEDCLYLNVWTPAPGEGKKLPVMLWIYGGSNRSGWAHQVYYEGAGLAKRGVVTVFINYRVGIFGWMSHPALSQESAEGVSGNYGLLDQVAALQWVKRNISQFGGDPDKVTIAGESAGGLNVAALLASPLADGLFHRGIIQSGGFSRLRNLGQNEELGTKIMAQLDVGGEGEAAQMLRDMRALGSEDVLLASNEVRGRAGYGPVIDGHVLPEPILDRYARRKQQPVEVMVGVNAHEFSLFLPRTYAANKDGMPTEENYKQALAFYAGSKDGAEALRTMLEGEAGVFRRMERLNSVGWFLCQANEAARLLAASGHDVYYYFFTRAREGQKQWIGAHHAAEIPYVFDTGNHMLPSNESDYALTQAMGDYWANFVRTGNPNSGDLENWPLFEADTGLYLDLGDKLMMGSGLETDLCAAIPVAH